MASWTEPVTHATGDVLAVTDWNGLANDITFLYEAPYTNAYMSAAASVATATATQLPLGTVAFSAYGFALDTSTGNLTMPLTGLYAVQALATLTTTAAGPVSAQVYHNGSMALSGGWAYGPAGNTPASASGILLVTNNDNIGLWCTQATGSTINAVTGAQATWLSAYFVGSQ